MREWFGYWARGGDVYGARGWCKRRTDRVRLIRAGEKKTRGLFKREIARQLGEG